MHPIAITNIIICERYVSVPHTETKLKALPDVTVNKETGSYPRKKNDRKIATFFLQDVMVTAESSLYCKNCK